MSPTTDGDGGGGAQRGTVLIALHNDSLNGATISVLRAVPLLEERGWRFVFWVPQPGAAADSLRERGAVVRGRARPIASGLQGLRQPPGVARRLAASPAYAGAFAAAIRELDPRLVHANSLYSFAEALIARALRPTMLHVHDMAPVSRKAIVARRLCRRGVNLTVAVSKACAASYAYGGWSPGIVYESAPIPAQPVTLRRAPKPFVVGMIGVIARRKGVDTFVDAGRRLLADGERIELRIVGQPSDPLDRAWGERVLERARGLGISHEPRVEVLEEIRGWDAFVLPSRIDPFPLVMLEAMASGLPVIGTRVDGLAEQITPETGILVDPEDPAALADAIRSLAKLPYERRAAIGAAARERVAANFSVTAQAEALDRAYLRTIAAAGRRLRKRGDGGRDRRS